MNEEYLDKCEEMLEEINKNTNNEIYKLNLQIFEKDKEIERLNNIINKLEYWLKMEWHYNADVNEQYAEAIENTLDRLKALKEGKKW